MPFFEVPADEDVPPEVRTLLDQYRRERGLEPQAGWRAFALVSRILEARIQAQSSLFLRCRFPMGTKALAFMLIAHRAQCQTCFRGSRAILDGLGLDEPTLDAICVNPDALPLPERDRTFVDYAVRIANDPASMRRSDYEAMAARGLSRDEIQEVIGFAAYVNMNITFTKAQLGWMADE